MDALGLFVERYDAIHGRFVGDLFAGLADAQVRARPSGVNSIAWLVWHLTRHCFEGTVTRGLLGVPDR